MERQGLHSAHTGLGRSRFYTWPAPFPRIRAWIVSSLEDQDCARTSQGRVRVCVCVSVCACPALWLHSHGITPPPSGLKSGWRGQAIARHNTFPFMSSQPELGLSSTSVTCEKNLMNDPIYKYTNLCAENQFLRSFFAHSPPGTLSHPSSLT